VRAASEPEGIGGFRIEGRLVDWAEAPLSLARDETLRRNVWLHQPGSGATAAPERRRLARSARLRWIAGVEEEGWDAYEAVDGAPITILGGPQPWDRVRGWLRTTLQELVAGDTDGVPIRLVAAEQIWLTPDGRLKLVDPALLGFESGSDDGWERTQRVLLRAFGRALAPEAPGPDGVPATPLPLRVREILERLERGDLEGPSQLLATIEHRRGTSASLARRRAVSVAIQAAPAILTAGFFVLIGLLADAFPAFFQGETRLRICVDRLVELEDPSCAREPGWESEHRALQICVAAGVRQREKIASRWSEPGDRERLAESSIRQLIGKPQRSAARTALQAYPDPNEEEIQWVEQQLESLLANASHNPLSSADPSKRAAVVTFLTSFVLVALGLGALVTVPTSKGGLTFRLLGLAIVKPDGVPASRWRCVLRGAIAWSLPLTAAVLLVVRGVTKLVPWEVVEVVSMAAALAMLAGSVWALVRPSRSLQDLLADTRVVPR
jgi:hypothetical protein